MALIRAPRIFVNDKDVLAVSLYKRLVAVLAIAALLFLSTAAWAAKADGLNEAMMGEGIKGGFGDFSIDPKETFTSQSREVIWFASFKGFIGAPEAKLAAEWVTPAGEVFKREAFTTKWGNSRFGWAKLDIQGVDKKALEIEGEWTVRVYWDDELIDTRTFHLGERKFKEPAPVPVSSETAGVDITLVAAQPSIPIPAPAAVPPAEAPEPAKNLKPAAKGSDFAKNFEPMKFAASEKLDDGMKKLEAELFKHSATLEEKLHTHGIIYEDPRLEEYLNNLIPIETLGEEGRGFHFRVKVIKDPGVGAFMMPSGSIYIHSGLFSVAENSDQMRVVLLHEAKHGIDRDIVHNQKQTRDQTAFIKLFEIAAMPAVAVAISQTDSSTGKTIANVATGTGLLMQAGYLASVTGYGRNNEIECDEYAVSVIHKHNYSLKEAQKFFENFDAEANRYTRAPQTHLFSTHESLKDRVKRIEKFKEKNQPQDVRLEAPAADPFMDLTYAVRKDNAKMNIQIGRIQHALDDLDKLAKFKENDAQVQYLRGEAYRTLVKDPKLIKEELKHKEWQKLMKPNEETKRLEWAESSKSAYARAIEAEPGYADPHRGLGLLQEELDDYLKGSEHLEKYLALSPNAHDKRYVLSKLEKFKLKLNPAIAESVKQKG